MEYVDWIRLAYDSASDGVRALWNCGSSVKSWKYFDELGEDCGGLVSLYYLVPE